MKISSSNRTGYRNLLGFYRNFETELKKLEPIQNQKEDIWEV